MFPHTFPFDPTYGYTQEQLLKIQPPEPIADFAAFWQETYAQTLATPADVSLCEVTSPRQSVRVFEIEYSGLGGFRVGGWLVRPADGAFKRGIVGGHGYGGRGAPDYDQSGDGAVAIYPCARGFHRSQRHDLPCTSDKHVILGIESRETYMHRYCVADLWSAVSALVEVAPEVSGCIDYIGRSFGGGIGTLALPWEPRFTRAFVGVPSFGNHPLRLTLPCVGSGESVRLYSHSHPRVIDVLHYFDSAVAAQFCRIPVMAACALFDPAVPPPGQFTVYNALAGQKRLFVEQADHFAWDGAPAEGLRLNRELVEWFG